MKPLLSICIPTYNRAIELQYLLDSIAPGMTPEVEIVICDNCSQDHTLDVVAAFRQRFPATAYRRWDTNMGPDRNFLSVVSEATGEYCWLMGSDDAVTPGGIGHMLELCRAGFDVALVNLLEASHDMRVFGEHQWLSGIDADQSFDLARNDVLKDFFERVQPLLGLFMGYISSVAVRRECWMAVNDKEQWVGTYFSFTYILMTLVAKGCKLQYVARPLLVNRGHNDSISEGLSSDARTRRALLDVNAYGSIANMFTDAGVRQSYLGIAKRNYSWLPLLKLRIFTTSRQWDEIKSEKLKALELPASRMAWVSAMGCIRPLFLLAYEVKQRVLPRTRLIPRRFY